MRSTRFNLAVGLFVVSALLRIGAIWFWDFDGLYGQDAYAYYENAKVLYIAFPDFEQALKEYWPVGTAHPIGYSGVMAISFAFTGVTPLSGQLISLLAGSLLAPLLFLLAVKLLALEGRNESESLKPALMAGLISSVSGVLVRSSIAVMSDALGLSLAVLAVWLALEYGQKRRLLIIMSLAAVTSMMMMVRFVYAAVALTILLYLYSLIRRGQKVLPLHISLGLAFVIIILLPQLLVNFRNLQAVIREGPIGNWSLSNLIGLHFETASGRQSYMLPNFLFYLAPVVYPPYFSPITFPALVAGVFVNLRRGYGTTLLLLGSWFMLVYLALIGSPLQNLRHAESYFPALAILTGIGFDSILTRWINRRTFLISWAALGLLSMGISGFIYLDRFLEIKRAEDQVIRWVKTNCSTDTNVLAFEITPALRHYSDFEVEELFYQDTTIVKEVLHPNKTIMVIDIKNIHTQWEGTGVFEVVRWIREHYSLTQIGVVNNYTVLRIGSPS